MTPSERANFIHEIASTLKTRAEPELLVLTSEVRALSNTAEDMKETLRELVKAMNRLALVEERISQVNEALGRAFKAVDLHAGRIRTLEDGQPIAKQQQGWVTNGLHLAAGAVAMFVLKKMGLL